MHEFRKCVRKYDGNYKVRSFTCLEQFLCMAFVRIPDESGHPIRNMAATDSDLRRPPIPEHGGHIVSL
jgi:hypothetical protein